MCYTSTACGDPGEASMNVSEFNAFLTLAVSPGLVPRSTTDVETGMRWESNTQSFISPGVTFAREGGVLVRGYDHFCVWTGTLIGAKNMDNFCCWACCGIVLVIFLLSIDVVGVCD